MRGINDKRGQLFHEYIKVLKDKQPKFFLAENVPGIVSRTHIGEFNAILRKLSNLGYNINYKLVDARDYGVPQERRRVIIVGYNKDLGLRFTFPPPTNTKLGTKTLEGKKNPKWLTLKEAIGDLPEPIPAKKRNHANDNLRIHNHEYKVGSFSSIYMSRNRKRRWNEQSYTIQAGGRHAPLHPTSTEMVKLEKDKWKFKTENPFFRRFSVRECARIQTFPDEFIFYYNNVADGYKMVGNAVPVWLAEALASKIKKDLSA